MGAFVYFGYGSNMLAERLQKRCPSARFLGVAYVEGYTLAFNKKSIDGSGKANIFQTKNDDFSIYGTLYEINSIERPYLDKYEGRGYSTNEHFSVKRMDNNEEITTTTYIATPTAVNLDLLPYDWYKKLVIAGAQRGNLPKSYISWLEAIPSIPDPCLNRKGRHEALALLESFDRKLMNTPDNVKIAGKLTVGDWKKLEGKLKKNGGTDNWNRAYCDFFFVRLKTRYLDPIKLLKESEDKIGEGFSITTLLCSLIEFLAATRLGKNYRSCPPEPEKCKCGEHEYHRSIELFKVFLCEEVPFKSYFKSKTQADNFYKYVRCPLFHEARTKGGWRIHAGDKSDPPIDVCRKIVYRDKFLEAINNYLASYRLELLTCPKLQEAFIRKFESLTTE